MTTSSTQLRRRAAVIGGSLGGLFVGVMLRRVGWDVAIYERSAHDLDSRGGGVVLQPEVLEVFRRAGVDTGAITLGVRSRNRTVLAPDGRVQSRSPAPQVQTSWSLIYTTMRQAFGAEGYHQDKTLVGVRHSDAIDTVTAVFADGEEVDAHLLVGADGGGSTVRRLLWAGAEPTYAGYLAWRGLVPEDELPAIARDALAGDFAFANAQGSHMLGYLVPGDGGDTRPGRRLYNFVWYRVADLATLEDVMTDRDGVQRRWAMPEGKLADRWAAALAREADALLPPPFRALVHATRQPFAQAIRDLRVERMVQGRALLLGDAAFIPRPHTAASTSKAAANALALGDAVRAHPNDLERALSIWEPRQLALGNRLYDAGRAIGDQLLFGPANGVVG